MAALSAAAALFVWQKRRHNAKKTNHLNRTSDEDDDDEDELQDQTQQNAMNNLVRNNDDHDDTNARIDHANSSSRYPYSPTGFYYNQPQLPQISTTMSAVPAAGAGAGAVTGGTSAAAAEAYANTSGEKQPPPAYEERESMPLGGSGGGDGVIGRQGETVHELPLSEAGPASDSNRGSTITGVGGPVDVVDTVVDGMRPPQEHQQQQEHPQPQVPELHEETSGRAELP